MKTRIVSLKSLVMTLGLLIAGLYAFAQQPALQYFRYNDKRGVNVFETTKDDTVKFDGVKVRVGGDFAIQFQGLSQENDANSFKELENNFNLPAANLNLDVQLVEGVRLHMRTYLSSRHHNEGWVKGGYLQVDNLDFISDGFLGGFMDVATIRFGYNDINYGDMHFRRSDNATVIYNPFVGNYIMDAFTTEPFGEITIQKNGILGVLGLTNGRLNQTTAKPVVDGTSADGDNGIALYLKLGYDKQFNEDLRFRITGSYYNTGDKGTRDYLYNGDRAGARYYEVYNTLTGSASNNDFRPRFNPGWPYLSAFQINPFLKFKGLEFFGAYEIANGGRDTDGSFTQTAAELLYRFGPNEKLYIGGRYNGVNGSVTEDGGDQKIARTNLVGGWFMTNNIIMKLEYVTESLTGDGWTGEFVGAKFNGVMVEAAISF
jgi:hypothetical protein